MYIGIQEICFTIVPFDMYEIYTDSGGYKSCTMMLSLFKYGVFKLKYLLNQRLN